MKRTLLILLTAALLLSVCRCGQASLPGPEDSGTQARQPESNENTGAVYTPSGEGITFLTAKTFSSDRVPQKVSSDFSRSYADFALRLLAECGDGALVSPLSVLTALQMTANGARGETLEEMRRVLGGDMTVEELNAQLFNYYESLNSTADAYIRYSNAVWTSDRTDFHVNPDFVRLVGNTFRADVATAPLFDPSTVDAINAWCAARTDGMIPKILGYDDVSYDTLMVLLNAICFDALWSSQYQPFSCRDAVFHGKSGDRTVTMMYSEESRYIKGDRESGFVKTYSGGDYAFVALLPDKGTAIDEYVKSLTADKLISLIGGAKGRVQAGLPKFSYDWSGSLVEIMQTLGMNLCFTERSDLSGLGYLDNGDALAISKIIHKTHIDVDESGTRAAAVTAVIVDRVTSVAPQTVPEVILDRPFVYAIIDTANGLPIFIGTACDID